ncbi:hypothetical protein ACFYY1_37085 [Streptomyces sp. NPDC001890]|uniref:hypothetical protein n=1 Tax=Streptomyces sp. NPDC001890 TaxID=3364620 RepID=UPI0036C22AA9
MTKGHTTDAACFCCGTPLGTDGVTLRENPMATDVCNMDPDSPEAREPMCDQYEQVLYDDL